MAEMMVGSTLQTPQRRGARVRRLSLDISGLSVPSPSAFGTALKNVHLTVRKGEILGIGGVAGNGQDELLGVLVRRNPDRGGCGEAATANPIGKLGPDRAPPLGVLAAPEERLGHAAAPT